MRKLFTLLLIVIGWSAHGQYQYFISFDAADTVNRKLVVIDTVNYHHNIWQIGKPSKDTFNTALSLPNVLITDTLHPYPSDDTSVFILKVPMKGDTCYISHSPAPLYRIELLYKMDIDTNATARIERSSDNGATWVDLDTIAYGLYWYDTSFDLTRSTHYWTNLRLGYPYALPLPDTLLYRFTFISDSNLANKEGWMIDNIWLQYWCEGAVPMLVENDELLSVYPNPSTGHISLHSERQPHDATVTVYDMLGRQVFIKDHVPREDYLDLSLPDGVYMLRYAAGEEYCIKRLMIAN